MARGRSWDLTVRPGSTTGPVYDFESLRSTLQTAGFREVRRYDWRDTVHKDFDDYSQAYIPHMDKEAGRLISLNVEADQMTRCRRMRR
jgi:hypothetical protein